MANFKNRSHTSGKEVRVIDLNYHQRSPEEDEPRPDYGSDATPRKKGHHEASR